MEFKIDLVMFPDWKTEVVSGEFSFQKGVAFQKGLQGCHIKGLMTRIYWGLNFANDKTVKTELSWPIESFKYKEGIKSISLIYYSFIAQ